MEEEYKLRNIKIMQTMDQFSHDLTVALEETSRSAGVRAGRWGTERRRTRSTGNLPCAPQPTEDSSSSPTDIMNEINSHNNQDGLNNTMLSDSDDRHDLRLSYKARYHGNFESDSLNENFSPARFFRPNTRRKRKFKRMAVEYETTPSTPGTTLNQGFPTSTVKKRVLRHTIQDNFRANLFFCGKRKRSHRDRYYDHDHGKQHSSSVPRQRDLFGSKSSYQDYKGRTRSFSFANKPNNERILPLNKNIVSKIEKISQQHRSECNAFNFTPVNLSSKISLCNISNEKRAEALPCKSITDNTQCDQKFLKSITTNVSSGNNNEAKFIVSLPLEKNILYKNQLNDVNLDKSVDLILNRRRHKHNRLRREQLRAQLQFDDPNTMECSGINEFLSSSSLSSSDSEAGETNDSDREGDDELTDWPGNEVMINFASKNDFKRRLTKKSTLPLIKSDDYAPGCDDDTLMSGDEVISPPAGVNFPLQLPKVIQSQPIAIIGSLSAGVSSQAFRFPIKQIESEMSGETSNNFLSSPPCQPEEIREIRAGCRRIRDERPGFTIITSVNERLARFLQDAQQPQLRLPDIEINEHENLMHLAKLYSLQMTVHNGCAVLTKTSNTTQSVKIDQQNFGGRFFLSDYKRRCYGERTDILDNENLNKNIESSIFDDKGSVGNIERTETTVQADSMTS